MTSNVFRLYQELLKKHGPGVKYWPQWCAKERDLRTRELIAIGAILTQRTSWHNADLALRNLKRNRLLSLNEIAKLSGFKDLTGLIRVAGFYQTKPRRLFEFILFIVKNYGSLENFARENTKKAREELLSCYGIGPETADTILLYALDKPTFVVDAYTQRLVKEKSLAAKFDYDYLKKFFEKNLPCDVEIYQNFHTLIIVEQKGKAGSTMSVI